MIKQLKEGFNYVTQTWYADYSNTMGTFASVESYFNSLKRFSPGQEYYPETSKVVLIIPPENVEAIQRFGLCHRFNVCMSARYFGFLLGVTSPKLIG